MAQGITETEKVLVFWGGWPSQWAPAQFEVDGVRYNCCEQYMMAEKARVFGDDETLEKILASKNPRDQKALGRKVANFDAAVWAMVCRGIVYAGNLARFSQDAATRDLLLATGEKLIVEGSPHDRIWGVGLAPENPAAQDPKQWRGTNWLGVALMQVRQTLRARATGKPDDPTDVELIAQLKAREAVGRALPAAAAETTIDYRPVLDAAISAAKEAGAILRAAFVRSEGPGGPAGKCPADADAEKVIRERLATAFPDYGQRGEELGRLDRPAKDGLKHVWLIDPNDGTSAYQKGHRGAAVSIALLRDGRPVLGVVLASTAPQGGEDLIAWAEGCGPVTRNGKPVDGSLPKKLHASHTVTVSQSADHSATANSACVAPARFRAVTSVAYRMALVAAGEAAAGTSLSAPQDWDYAAAHALLIGRGGELVGHNGKPITYTADGKSSCGGRCFGGSLEVATALAKADWSKVTRPDPADGSRYGLLKPEPGKAVEVAGRLDRAAGCLLGQFAGDALGSLVEFKPADEIAANYPDGPRDLADGGSWNTIAGQPTDDSEMTLMLARSLVKNGRFDEEDVISAYVHWYQSPPFDIGGTTSQALSAAANGSSGNRAAAARKGGSVESQANGAMMRVSPLGVFGHAVSADQLAEWARADASLTHPHSICRDASALFAVTIAYAVRTGASSRDVYDFARDWAARHCGAEIRQSLADAETAPPKNFTSQMGWVRIALQNAFYRLLHTTSFEQGVVETVRAGGDTDTNGAIAGALLGAVHGVGVIPAQWKDRVLTCRPQKGRSGVHRPRPKDFWPVDALILAERLLFAGTKAASSRSSE